MLNQFCILVVEFQILTRTNKLIKGSISYKLLQTNQYITGKKYNKSLYIKNSYLESLKLIKTEKVSSR